MVFELNFVAHQFDVFPAGRVGRIRRNHEQAYVGTFFPADHLNDFIEPHLTHIDKLILRLGDGGDPVAHLQSSIHLRRTARNKALDFGVAILGPKHGADSHEREAHVNAEIFHVGLAQILGMRVVRLGKRIEEELYLLVLVLLVDVAREAIVAAADQLRGRLDRMLA